MFDSWSNWSIILVNTRGTKKRDPSNAACLPEEWKVFIIFTSFLLALSSWPPFLEETKLSISFALNIFFMFPIIFIIKLQKTHLDVLLVYQSSWLPRLLLIVSIWSNWGRSKSGLAVDDITFTCYSLEQIFLKI